MYIGDLEELIKRNETYPNIRFIASRWGKRQGAPDGTLTVLVGDWPMTYKYGKAYVSPQHIAAYNIPYPWVPRDAIAAEDGTILKNGYRTILRNLLRDRAIRWTPEIQRVLESEENL